MKLDAYTVRVVEIQLGLGMLRMIKFGMLLEKDSLLYMKPSKILFFVKFRQPELLIKFPKLWMLLKKIPKLC